MFENTWAWTRGEGAALATRIDLQPVFTPKQQRQRAAKWPEAFVLLCKGHLGPESTILYGIV